MQNTASTRTAADGVDETISKLLGGDEVDEEVDDVGAISQEIYELGKESKERYKSAEMGEEYRCVGDLLFSKDMSYETIFRLLIPNKY